MSFLFPLYLLGALAIGIPIYLHLRRRPPKDTLPFGSLMFLEPTRAPRVKRRSRFENILLLLLRCAALLFLALMFSRPFLPAADDSADGAAARRLVLIDVSASMQRPEVWKQAIEFASKQVANTEPDASLALYTFDSEIRPLLDFDAWQEIPAINRRDAAQALIDDLRPGFGSTDLGNALVQSAEALLADNPPGGTQLILVSDLQQSAKTEALRQFDWPPEIAFLNANIDANPANASLAWGPSDSKGQPQVVVRNNSDSADSQLKLQWKGAPTADTIAVPPGATRVVPAPARTNPATAATLVLRGDSHPFDNELHLADPVPAPLPILYFGNRDSKDPATPYFYIHRAFQPTEHLAPSFPEPGESDPADVAMIVIESSATDLPLDVLRSATDRTILVLAQNPDAANLIESLANVSDLKVEPVETRDFALLQNLDTDHPALAAFRDTRFRDFTKVHFWNHLRLDPKTLPEDARILAEFDTGDPALVLFTAPNVPKVIVFLSGWHPEASQLSRSSRFVPLLYSLFQIPPRTLTTFQIGQTLPAQTTVTLPDGSEAEALVVATQPGIHRAGDRAYAVNLPPAESDLTPLPADHLATLGLARPASDAKSATAGSHASALQRESRQKIWRHLVVATLVIILIESILANRRQQPSPAV